MGYKVAIRNNATGEVRIGVYDELEWHDSSVFFWTEGNFGCDCNRELEFTRAGGPGPADDPYWNGLETECGNGRFSALYAEFADGSRVPLDDESPQPGDG